jgi:amino acid transporter
LADKIGRRSKLSFFDVTNLVVGAIIGADIYVASSFGAGYLGPSSLLIWIAAGFITIVIALCFAQCSALLPRTGGPYAYAKEAWGPFAGFIVGWSLWLAEWTSLAVFPLAFVRYLMFFLPELNWMHQVIIKALFVFSLIATNIVGVRAAGRTNDILTLIKLTPLVFFMGIGLVYMSLHPETIASNFTPFSPYGFGNSGSALILIFWAYAGFEISTIPAEEIDNPSSTIPKAIMLGIAIVMFFYLTTNAVLFGVRPWQQLASDTAPLASANATILSVDPTLALIGGGIVGVGALVSVAGSDESGMIGTSRLGYALAADGLFPRVFAKIHPRFKIPYLGIVIQAMTALTASIVGNIGALIATSVFFMAIAYVATSASIFWLRSRGVVPSFHLRGGSIIPWLGILFSLYLISQCTLTQIGTGLILILIGVPIYVKYSPKKEMTEIKGALLSRTSILRRALTGEEQFLAHILRHIIMGYRRIHSRKRGSDDVDSR